MEFPNHHVSTASRVTQEISSTTNYHANASECCCDTSVFSKEVKGLMDIEVPGMPLAQLKTELVRCSEDSE